MGRRLNGVVFGGLVSLMTLGGCPQPQGIEESTTGVSGMNTPEEILADENVARAIDFLQRQGYNINPSRELSPPNVEGVFEPERNGVSFQIMPNPYAGDILPFIALNIKDQGSDGYVSASRLQLDPADLDSGEQTLGRTIIRGNDRHFTIYSVEGIQAGNVCRAQRAWIIDGTKNDDGTFTTLDLRIPTEIYTPECVFPNYAESISYTTLGDN
jgi:hypothetical protein